MQKRRRAQILQDRQLDGSRSPGTVNVKAERAGADVEQEDTGGGARWCRGVVTGNQLRRPAGKEPAAKAERRKQEMIVRLKIEDGVEAVGLVVHAEFIGSVAAGQHVGAAATRQRVVAIAADQGVIAGTAVQTVIAAQALQTVISRTAEQLVVARCPAETVVRRRAIHHNGFKSGDIGDLDTVDRNDLAIEADHAVGTIQGQGVEPRATVDQTYADLLRAGVEQGG